MIAGAGGVPMNKGLEEGDVGAAVALAFLRRGGLVNNSAPLRADSFVANGRDKAEEGGGDGKWALEGDSGEASGFGNKDGKVNR